MKSKEKLLNKLNKVNSSKFYSGCSIDDKQCLISSVFSTIDSDAMNELKSILFDTEILKIMKDKELLRSVDEFFNNNLNISETSRNAFLHRNTLIYRIDKIKKATGFNIKNFNDAVSFKILEMLYENLGEENDQ